MLSCAAGEDRCKRAERHAVRLSDARRANSGLSLISKTAVEICPCCKTLQATTTVAAKLVASPVWLGALITFLHAVRSRGDRSLNANFVFS